MESGAQKNNAGLLPGVVFLFLLALRNCAHGAGIRTGTAIKASTGVDLIKIGSLRNGAYGTGIHARAAADASIADDISHYVHLP